MLSTAPGPDPYFVYKMHHIDRAKATWALAEEFGVYEALRAGPATIAEVSQRIGLQERPTTALLISSACLGILGVEDDQYHIFEIMRAMVLEGGRARTTPRPPSEDDWWYHILKKALVANEPLPEALPPWLAYPNDEGVDRQAFSPGRHGWRRLWGEALADAFDFSAHRIIADIGGATGGVLVGLTEKHPHLAGVLVDLPYARRSAEAAIAEDGASDRVRFHAANMFEDELPEVDVFFMSHVIHDWDDEYCIKLLRRCYEALPPDGVVLVQEYLLNEDKTGSLIGIFQWCGLLTGTTGEQRNAAEIAVLLKKAGFVGGECRPIDHEQSIVIGRKE